MPTLQQLADKTGATLSGNGARVVGRLCHPLDWQHETDLVLAMDKDLAAQLPKVSGLMAVLAHPPADPATVADYMVVARPRVALAVLTNLFAAASERHQGVHPTAVVHATAKLGNNISIGPHAVIGAGAVIGDGVTLEAQNYIGENSHIGEGCLLHSGARVGANVRMGNHCLVHFNAVVGSDGFSFVTPQESSVEAAKNTGAVSSTNILGWRRIASLGGVVVGDEVEIGANACIDQGTIRPTRIGRGSKIDNLVQIGHNVEVGEDCLICGQAGIAGSTVLGHRVVMGGHSGAADHITLGDDVVVMAYSGVGNNVPPKTIVGGGIPAQPREKAVEIFMALQRLPRLHEKVNDLMARLITLEQSDKKS